MVMKQYHHQQRRQRQTRSFLLWLFVVLVGILSFKSVNGETTPDSVELKSAPSISRNLDGLYLRQQSAPTTSSASSFQRQLQEMDFFDGEELTAAEAGFVAAFVLMLVIVLLLCCCCCGGGRRGRGGGCSICDLLMCFCIWEICCDGGGGVGDVCLL